jgi:L-asparagine transporter-like permease
MLTSGTRFIAFIGLIIAGISNNEIYRLIGQFIFILFIFNWKYIYLTVVKRKHIERPKETVSDIFQHWTQLVGFIGLILMAFSNIDIIRFIGLVLFIIFGFNWGKIFRVMFMGYDSQTDKPYNPLMQKILSESTLDFLRRKK